LLCIISNIILFIISILSSDDVQSNEMAHQLCGNYETVPMYSYVVHYSNL
jgi:hypothetical protein